MKNRLVYATSSNIHKSHCLRQHQKLLSELVMLSQHKYCQLLPHEKLFNIDWRTNVMNNYLISIPFSTLFSNKSSAHLKKLKSFHSDSSFLICIRKIRCCPRFRDQLITQESKKRLITVPSRTKIGK